MTFQPNPLLQVTNQSQALVNMDNPLQDVQAQLLTCVVRAFALFLAMMGCTSLRTSMSCCTFQKLSFSSRRFRPLRWFFCAQRLGARGRQLCGSVLQEQEHEVHTPQCIQPIPPLLDTKLQGTRLANTFTSSSAHALIYPTCSSRSASPRIDPLMAMSLSSLASPAP